MAQEWWKETVFYQIYPRSFSDSNGDGIGDIPGIISKLDYLKDLGIGAIWLSPVYRSPNHDNGYDISDYYDINPEYGTLGDMKQLFAKAKQRGVRIIMDLVINHTSDEHPWFVAAQNPDSPYRDYYIWKDPKRKGNRRRPPNNWISYFASSAWSWDEASGQYYLHLYSPHQPDLNYRNPKIIEEVKKIMRFWLDLGAAGFRCDTINVIFKTTLDDGHYSLSHLPGSEYYRSQPGAHAILKELRRDVLGPYGAFTVGEMTDAVDAATAKQFTTGELDAIFTFEHVNVDTWAVPFLQGPYYPWRLKNALVKWQQILPWNTLFFENHDTNRSLSKFTVSGRDRKKGAMMLAALLLTLKGIPFIYQGEEIGMENYPFVDIDQLEDTSPRSLYAVLRHYHVPEKIALHFAMMVCRDNARTPMQWDNSPQAGFTTGVPWRPVHPNYEEVNVTAERADRTSVYAFYHELIHLRNSTPALQKGSVTIVPTKGNIFFYRREFDGTAYSIIINMGPKSLSRPQLPDGENVLSNYDDSNGSEQKLRPYEVTIVREVPHA